MSHLITICGNKLTLKWSTYTGEKEEKSGPAVEACKGAAVKIVEAEEMHYIDYTDISHDEWMTFHFISLSLPSLAAHQGDTKGVL